MVYYYKALRARFPFWEGVVGQPEHMMASRWHWGPMLADSALQSDGDEFRECIVVDTLKPADLTTLAVAQIHGTESVSGKCHVSVVG